MLHKAPSAARAGAKKAAAAAATRHVVFSARDKECFLAAASSGNLAKVRQYLARGYDPSVDQSRALALALKSYPVMSELLAQHGARVEDVAEDAVLARDRHHYNYDHQLRADMWKVELILSHLSPASDLLPRLLPLALAEPALVKLLLRIGVEPSTALGVAIKERFVDSALALLDAGVAKGALQANGFLSLACEAPALAAVVRRLLEAGAHPDEPRAMPPLLVAINSNALDSARTLLRFGADPDLRGACTAALSALPILVPDLLRHGASFRLEPVTYWQARIPLEIMGLLLRARVHWAHRFALRMVQREVPSDTTVENARAMALAKASLTFPHMHPQKLL